jgi:hypothetical protein
MIDYKFVRRSGQESDFIEGKKARARAESSPYQNGSSTAAARSFHHAPVRPLPVTVRADDIALLYLFFQKQSCAYRQLSKSGIEEESE